MKLRIRISLDIADGQIPADITPQALKATYGPLIGRAVAQGLPEGITVDTAVVTKMNVAAANAPVEE